MTMRSVWTGAAVATALAAGGARAATVEVLYDNLDGGVNEMQGYAPYSDYVGGPLADSFSTGASPVLLDQVKVLLQVMNQTSSTASASVLLLADDNKNPGATIETLGNVADDQLSTTPTVISFSGGDQLLAANTRYWIGISTSQGTAGEWDQSGDTSGPGVAGEYYSGVYFGSPDTSSNKGSFPYQMEVTATAPLAPAAPEPAAWALLTLGVGGAGLALRRARRIAGVVRAA